MNLKEKYDTDGYVIVPGLLSSLDADLEQACDRVIARTREGNWPHRRIIGRQFPPYESEDERPDCWGVQHVMHPDLAEPDFAKWYGSRNLIDVVCELLDCSEDHLQMGT